MGYCPDWNRQNMKKTGSSGPTTTPSRKDMGSLFHSAPATQSKSMAKPMRLADGDTEATYKARGMEASSGENVGFFERLRMGNIDQEGSEAYNRFGAGRAKADEAETARLANRAAAAAKSRQDDADFDEMDRQISSGRSVSGAEPKMTASDAKRETKDYDSTPVSMPRRRATSSVSGSAVRAASPSRSSEPPMKSVMTDNSYDRVESARLNRAAPAPIFDPNAINFAGRPKAKVEDEKPKSASVTRSRAYYSGKSN